jgi:leucyl-tRNA---protein transferase
VQQIAFLKVVSDGTDVCPYLPDQTARMPLSLATSEITPEKLDALLAAGYRRSGWYYYRTHCPRCAACEPVRIEAARFSPSRSQRRTWTRGNQHLRITWDQPQLDMHRVRLFNKHRQIRNLGSGEGGVTAADYQSFLVNASCQVVELQLWYENQLVAVSITDIGENSLSAVYCFFDPDFSWLGLGTYAILCQIEAAVRPTQNMPFGAKRWVYLGLYVERNQHLNYKSRFAPQQRFINGAWREFEHRGTESSECLTD